MPMPTGNGENPQFYRLWTVVDSQQFTKTKNSISLDSRFVDLENSGEHATLSSFQLYFFNQTAMLLSISLFIYCGYYLF